MSATGARKAGKAGVPALAVRLHAVDLDLLHEWTFYGAVGSAARNGLEFSPIYLGPTLVFVGWWFLLRKLVRISHTHAHHLDRRPDVVALRQDRAGWRCWSR